MYAFIHNFLNPRPLMRAADPTSDGGPALLAKRLAETSGWKAYVVPIGLPPTPCIAYVGITGPVGPAPSSSLTRGTTC